MDGWASLYDKIRPLLGDTNQKLVQVNKDLKIQESNSADKLTCKSVIQNESPNKR